MPRKPSDNTVAVSLRIPPEWNELADALAERESGTVARVTRTEMLRHALGVGLQKLKKGGKS